jgi:hypothetical protein
MMLREIMFNAKRYHKLTSDDDPHFTLGFDNKEAQIEKVAMEIQEFLELQVIR